MTAKDRLISFLERRLERKRVRFVCVAIMAATLVLLAISFITCRDGQTVFGTQLGADYAAFYIAGQILNEGSVERLYDLDLQHKRYHQLFPRAPRYESLPYVYPPFVAFCFRPLALLPYEWSYATWLGVSLGFFLAAVASMRKTFDVVPPEHTSTIVLLLLSFEPFLMECWVGGQLSAIGLFWVALGLYCLRLNRPVAAGAAFALCLYKPTLLMLILPMLVVGRRYRMLLGFLLSALGLAAVSFVLLGGRGCAEYVRLLTGFTQATSHGSSVFRLWKFVDLASFFNQLQGGHTKFGLAIMAALFVVGLWLLGRAWWRCRPGDTRENLLWACTLTWTLVLNLYVCIYETVLVLPAMILITGVFWRGPGSLSPSLPPLFRALLVFLYVTPWFSQYLAQATRIQLYTLVLLAAGAYPLWLASRSRITDDGVATTAR